MKMIKVVVFKTISPSGKFFGMFTYIRLLILMRSIFLS